MILTANKGQYKDSRKSGVYEHPALVVAGKPLLLGSKLRCHFKSTNSTVVDGQGIKRAHVLHAILWPTVVFIAGFVGLFFSCIMLQKAKSQHFHAAHV